MVGSCTFAKTICSICYEDLNPIVEDLQSISICGHVFHELCLQQWFEYCSASKKYSCPVCKQICKVKDAARLYFQSVGDTNDLTLQRKPVDCGNKDPEALCRKVRMLETKISGLTSAYEHQGKDLNELKDELRLCKEQAQKELVFKNEAINQKAICQQLLHLKSEEVNKSNMECTRLQERSMALAKELAAFKLVSDLDLDDDEMVKLASLGNGATNTDTVDILKKSLVMRNRSYKELMQKCNIIGRENARSCQKLEKAERKINKPKVRLQELEIAAESKDNEVLRALKTTCERVVPCRESCDSHSLLVKDSLPDHREKQNSAPWIDATSAVNTSDPLSFKGKSNFDSRSDINVNCIPRHDANSAANFSDPSAFKRKGSFNPKSDNCTAKAVINLDFGKDIDTEETVHSVADINTRKTVPSPADENIPLLVDDDVEPFLNIKKESSTLALSRPGNICFSSGLRGPDGTNRYLGKWCKRGQGNRSMEPQSSPNGDLISVGADGRGGRIKVLRSPNQTLMGFVRRWQDPCVQWSVLFSDRMYGVPYRGRYGGQPDRQGGQLIEFRTLKSTLIHHGRWSG